MISTHHTPTRAITSQEELRVHLYKIITAASQLAVTICIYVHQPYSEFIKLEQHSKNCHVIVTFFLCHIDAFQITCFFCYYNRIFIAFKFHFKLFCSFVLDRLITHVRPLHTRCLHVCLHLCIINVTAPKVDIKFV